MVYTVRCRNAGTVAGKAQSQRRTKGVQVCSARLDDSSLDSRSQSCMSAWSSGDSRNPGSVAACSEPSSSSVARPRMPPWAPSLSRLHVTLKSMTGEAVDSVEEASSASLSKSTALNLRPKLAPEDVGSSSHATWSGSRRVEPAGEVVVELRTLLFEGCGDGTAGMEGWPRDLLRLGRTLTSGSSRPQLCKSGADSTSSIGCDSNDGSSGGGVACGTSGALDKGDAASRESGDKGEFQCPFCPQAGGGKMMQCYGA